jgi:hypothetical protein
MTTFNQWKPQNYGLLGTVIGSLLISALPVTQAALAQSPTPQVNPCPRIFYEEPHNSRVAVPPGCPPNAFTLQLGRQEQSPSTDTEVTVPTNRPMNSTDTRVTVPTNRPITSTQPPLPENSQNAITTVTPMAGRVSVTMKNDTNSRISYQALGHTETRTLTGGEEITLENLPIPVTITIIREDGGFVRVNPATTSKPGMLAVLLDEATTFENSQAVLRIERNGQVFLN